MKFDLLIFDLDGTLIDSQVDVGRALNRLLADHRLDPIDDEVIRTHVGYGIQPLIVEKLREIGTIDVAPAFQKFAAYYLERCVEGTVLYPGVRETLAQLSNYRMVILTNKSTKFIDKILTGLGIESHFISQYGRESFARTKPDPLPILSILREHNVEPERALMIGDTETDIFAGTNAGVSTCLVTYGYGNPVTLETLRPTYTISALEELPSLL